MVQGLIFFGPPTLTGHSFTASRSMIIFSGSFESSKLDSYTLNLKNSKAALLRYVIPIRSTPILYHKLQKSPVFLQATIPTFFLEKSGFYLFYLTFSFLFFQVKLITFLKEERNP